MPKTGCHGEPAPGVYDGDGNGGRAAMSREISTNLRGPWVRGEANMRVKKRGAGLRAEGTVSEPTQGRFFRAGCIRSGTRLLHCPLAAHARIRPLRASMSFRFVVGDEKTRRPGRQPPNLPDLLQRWGVIASLRLGLAARSVKVRVHVFPTEIGRNDLEGLFARRRNSLGMQVKGRLRRCDTLTLEPDRQLGHPPLHPVIGRPATALDTRPFGASPPF